MSFSDHLGIEVAALATPLDVSKSSSLLVHFNGYTSRQQKQE